jgi:hypothetical protein
MPNSPQSMVVCDSFNSIKIYIVIRYYFAAWNHGSHSGESRMDDLPKGGAEQSQASGPCVKDCGTRFLD